MLGLTADDKRVAERSKGLLKQVKCGLYLFKQLATIAAMGQGVSVLGLLAILPWEKMVKRCPGISSLAEIADQCLVWMMERVARHDVVTFILDLAIAIQDYIRPSMVLDRLPRRPPTPTDAGDSPAPSDVSKFQQRLNTVLTKHHLPPLTTWELPGDPMDAMRCVEGRHLGVVYWDRAMAFANPTDPKPHAMQFQTTDHLLNLMANVEVLLSDTTIYAALMAMTGPGCPYDMVPQHHITNNPALDVTTSKQWIVVMVAPENADNSEHIYCALLLLSMDEPVARVQIISPLAGVEHDADITEHCRSIMDPLIHRSVPACTTTYHHYPVDECKDASEGAYSVGATMLHVAAIITTGRIYSGEPVIKGVSREIRRAGAHVLLCRRHPSPEATSDADEGGE